MATQLNYTLTNATPALYPGTPATLTLTATLPAGKTAEIQSITLDLTGVADTTAQNVTAETSLADWNCYDSSNLPQSISAGHVTLTPSQSPIKLTAPVSQSLVLTFSISLQVTSTTGPAPVSLTEFSSATDLIGAPVELHLTVSDQIEGIYSFVATDPVMNAGGSTSLSWTGSSDYSYTLVRSDGVKTGVTDQQLQAGGNGSYPETGAMYQNTVFTLKAQHASEVDAQLVVAISQPSHFTCFLEDSTSGAQGESLTVDLYQKVTVHYSAANISQVELYNDNTLITTINTTKDAKAVQNQDPPLVTGTVDVMATRNAALTLKVTGNGVTLTKSLTLGIKAPRVSASLTKNEIYVDAADYRSQINYSYANANAIFYALGENAETECFPLDATTLSLNIEPTRSETISVRAALLDAQQPQISLWSESTAPEQPAPPPDEGAPSQVNLPFKIITAELLWAKDNFGNSSWQVKNGGSSFKVKFSKPVGFWTVVYEDFKVHACDGIDHSQKGHSKFKEIQITAGVSVADDGVTVNIDPTICIKDKSHDRTYSNQSYINMRVMGVPKDRTNFLATRSGVDTSPLSIPSDKTGDLYSVPQGTHWTGNDSSDHQFQEVRWAMDLKDISKSDGRTTFNPSVSTDVYKVSKGVSFSGSHTVMATNTSEEGCGYTLLRVALPKSSSNEKTMSGTFECDYPLKEVHHMIQDFDMKMYKSKPAQLDYFYSGGATSASVKGKTLSYDLISSTFKGYPNDMSLKAGYDGGGHVLFLLVYAPK